MNLVGLENDNAVDAILGLGMLGGRRVTLGWAGVESILEARGRLCLLGIVPVTPRAQLVGGMANLASSWWGMWSLSRVSLVAVWRFADFLATGRTNV